MRKIISVCLLLLICMTNLSITFGQDTTTMDPNQTNWAPVTTTESDLGQGASVDLNTSSNNQNDTYNSRSSSSCAAQDSTRTTSTETADCWAGYKKVGFTPKDTTTEIRCCQPVNKTDKWTSTSVMGITCSPDQLVNGQCKLNIYDTLGIRKSVRNKDQATSVGLFVQDVVLSATFFIGTLVTVALIVSGLMFIFAASSGKDPANAKKGIIGSLVGLLIVVSSYVIIRLVQYIAKGF